MAARKTISRRPVERVKGLVWRARARSLASLGEGACYRGAVRTLPLACLMLLWTTLAAPRVASAEVVEPPRPCQGTTPAGVRVCAGLDAAEREQWAEAEAMLESALVLDDPILELLAEEIRAALEVARAHLGSLEVRCAPRGATIVIDGLERGLDPLDRPLRLAIGSHVVRCTAADHAPVEQTFEVTRGALSTATLTLVAHDHRPILERVGSPGESQRVVGIVALSLGGATLAVGLGTLFAGLDATGADREPFFDVARGTLIAGGVLVVAGIVLVLTAE